MQPSKMIQHSLFLFMLFALIQTAAWGQVSKTAPLDEGGAHTGINQIKPIFGNVIACYTESPIKMKTINQKTETIPHKVLIFRDQPGFQNAPEPESIGKIYALDIEPSMKGSSRFYREYAVTNPALPDSLFNAKSVDHEFEIYQSKDNLQTKAVYTSLEHGRIELVCTGNPQIFQSWYQQIASDFRDGNSSNLWVSW